MCVFKNPGELLAGESCCKLLNCTNILPVKVVCEVCAPYPLPEWSLIEEFSGDIFQIIFIMVFQLDCPDSRFAIRVHYMTNNPLHLLGGIWDLNGALLGAGLGNFFLELDLVLVEIIPVFLPFIRFN